MKFLKKNSFSGEDSESLSYERSVPTPQDQYPIPQLTAWGTTGLYNTVVSTNANGNELQYSFQSPWSPPTEWVKAVGAKFPSLSLELTFAEEGMNYRGRIKITGGSVVEEERHSYWREATNEDVAELFEAAPHFKNWRSFPTNVTAFLEKARFRDATHLWNIEDDSHRNLRYKLVRFGAPCDESLWGRVKDVLLERARAFARDQFASSVAALIALMKIQRRFKERFYRLGGSFEAIGSRRFSQQSTGQPEIQFSRP